MSTSPPARWQMNRHRRERATSPSNFNRLLSTDDVSVQQSMVALRCPNTPSASPLRVPISPLRSPMQVSEFLRSPSHAGSSILSLMSHPTFQTSFLHKFPAEVIFLVCFYLPATTLVHFGATCRFLYFLVCSHPVWKELVIKNYGFKYENYLLTTSPSAWKVVHDKIATFLRRLRNGDPEIHILPKALPPSDDPVSQPEGSLCLSSDGDTLVWQQGVTLTSVQLVRNRNGQLEAHRKWLVDLSTYGVRHVRISDTCLVLAPTKVFLFIDRRLFAFDFDTGLLITELQNSLGSWGAAREPALDISLRNHKVALLCNDCVHVWCVNTMRLDFVLTCPPMEMEMMRQRNRAIWEDRRENWIPPLPDTPEQDLQLLTPLADSTPDSRSTLSDTDPTRCNMDFAWAGYRCISGPDETPCMNCRRGYAQDVSCSRVSEYVVVWFRDKSPRVWLHDASTGAVCRVITCGEPDIADEWESKESHKFSKHLLAAPCVRRVKQTPNLSDPHHFFLVSLDVIGTIRLFDSSRHFVPLAVLRTGDEFILRASLSATTLFTITILDENGSPTDAETPFQGRVILRFWRFNQPAITDELRIAVGDTIPISSTDILCAPRSTSATIRKSQFQMQTANSYFNRSKERPPEWQNCECENSPPHIILQRQEPLLGHFGDTTSTKDWEEDEDEEEGEASPGDKVLEFISECQVSSAVYLCDILDSSFFALWYSMAKRGSFGAWCLTISNWRVFTGPPNLLKLPFGESEVPCSEDSPLGKQVFNMSSRFDAWTLLDWRSVSVENDGTLLVYDFCPISSKRAPSVRC